MARILRGHNFAQGGHLLLGHNLGGNIDSILALFNDGSTGFYLPLDDRTYMWQEDTGETPVTADNDPVGLVLDLSQGLRVTEDGGGNRAISGLEPDVIVNGDFTSDSDWVKGTGWTISAGAASSDGTQVSRSSLFPSVPAIAVGTWYRFRLVIKNYSAGSVRLRNGIGGSEIYIGDITANGTYTAHALVSGNTTLVIDADANFVGDVDLISAEPMPGNHHYQDTSAARSTWDAAEPGLDLDGTDDALKVDGLSPTATMSFGVALKTSDTVFDIFGGASSMLQVSSATTTALGYGGTLYIDGVKIYNASELDAQALSDGVSHFAEVRGADPSADTDFTLGDVTDNFDGIISRAYLTSNTNTSALDRARNYAAQQAGVTLRHTETLVGQVAAGGIYGPTDNTLLLHQDTDGDPATEVGGDPVALILNPAAGISVASEYGDKWGPHNLIATSSDIASWAPSAVGDAELPVVVDNGAYHSVTLERTGLTSASRSQIAVGVLAIPGGTEATAVFSVRASTPADIGRQIGVRHVGRAGYTLIALTGDFQTYEFSETALDSSVSSFELVTRGVTTPDPIVNFDIEFAGVYRSDLGGMADNPEYPDDPTYVPTTGTAIAPTRGARTYFVNGVETAFASLPVSTSLTQSTPAACPVLDEASGLLDYDGNDDHLVGDLTGIGDRSDMYLAFVIQTTDTTTMAVSSTTDANYYLLPMQSGSLTTTLTAGASPGGSIYVDGTLFTGTTWGELHTAVCDGNRHLVELIGAGLTDANFDTVYFHRYTIAGSWELNGLAGEQLLIPNPGVVGINIIRRDILAKHPSITFAGA